MGSPGSCDRQSYSTVICSVVFLIILTEGAKVPIKVVNEPSSFGFNYQQSHGYGEQTTTLKLRVKPSEFSGPPHLERLKGKCFSMVDNNYKYELCPFSNVTQHEQSMRWNPYKGVLGVWQEWHIEKNKFVAMVMREGDSCGSVYRSTKVLFECGDKNAVTGVTEPVTCQYELKFQSPLVCHPHSLLVYPNLNETIRKRWDEIEGEYYREEITEKGYNKSLRALFEDAGYCINKKKQEEISKAALHQGSQAGDHTSNEFYSLPQCRQEYDRLQQENAALRTQIAELQSRHVATSEALPNNNHNSSRQGG